MSDSRILVVDDDTANLELIQRRLEVDDFESVLVATGTGAIAAARDHDFAATLLDLRLPDMSGLEVLAELQRLRPQMPVVIMTAHGSETLAVKTLTAGAADYLIKPVGRRELVGALRNVIERQRLVDENTRMRRRLEETVTALEEALELAERDRQRLIDLTESLDEGVLLLSTAGRIERFNSAARAFWGVEGPVTEASALLASVTAVEDENGAPLDPHELLGARDVYDRELVVHFADGQTRALALTAKPLPGAGGVPDGRLLVFRDVTVRRGRRIKLEALLHSLESEVAEAHSRRHDEVERASREAEQVKHQIMAAVSHELRTPLNFIVGFGSVLADGVAGELTPEQFQLVEKMLVGAERLTATVEDLLTYAMLTSGMLEARREPLALEEVCREVVAQVGPEARDRGVSLACVASGASVTAVADREYLRQAIRQLLSNAVKFTPAGGSVEVRVDAGPPASITVSDTGIGMAPETVPHLFELFYQTEAGPTRRFGGTGLGLALVKGLTELLGLRVEVESALGAGSRFKLVWPEG